MSILIGKVTSGEDNVAADLTFKDASGAVVAKTSCDDDGNYFITLAGGNKYSSIVSAKGFTTTTGEIELPLGKDGETFIQVEKYQLDKVIVPED